MTIPQINKSKFRSFFIFFCVEASSATCHTCQRVTGGYPTTTAAVYGVEGRGSPEPNSFISVRGDLEKHLPDSLPANNVSDVR